MSVTPTTPAPAPASATPAAPVAPVEAPKPQAPATEAPAQRDAAGETLGEPGLKALRAERAERERLERELQPLKAQMEKLAGLFGGQTPEPGQDLVATLQEQVSKMQHDGLVDRVARRHGITDDNDVALLSKIADEATMSGLAERLKASNIAPSSPAPDPSQGSGPLSEEAASEAAYKAFFPQPSK